MKANKNLLLVLILVPISCLQIRSQVTNGERIDTGRINGAM